MHPKNNDPIWKRILVRSAVPEQLQNLQKLARNIWWSWNSDAQALFASIDAELWEKSQHNPVSLLEMLSYQQYQKLLADKKFNTRLKQVYGAFEAYMQAPKAANTPKIAYFCMEYGLHSVIKLYSGGLGVLAGDYLKEASDCNHDVIGVGLLYRYGYFKQSLSYGGEQIANYNPQKFSYLPVLPVKNADGNWVMISLQLPGRMLHARVWKIDVGRVPLYLLDTDLDENQEGDRFISHQLYGGDWENRLKQELLLGIGGIKALDALGVEAEVYHCNEGHAAFTGLERTKKFIQNHYLSYHQALEVVKSSSLFTTHTPVPAGHDAFEEELLKSYLFPYSEIFQISWDKFMALGRINEYDHDEKFSMSHLAARMSQAVNGVSKIHGQVSREMLNPLWPGYATDEIHVDYVTNGVHYYSWTAVEFQQLYDKYLGQGIHHNQADISHWSKIHQVPDAEIWAVRKQLKAHLFDSLSRKMTRDLTLRQETPGKIISTINSFDENALTIGFARRFATYKRAHLLFKNLDRLKKIVNIPGKPVQFVFAGKAHPADKGGQELIKKIVEVSQLPDFAGKVFFVENYDMALARRLVHGVDVWLNTPTRPLEASGTSGMKATMNGVLNLSVLDGWWAEGYTAQSGWALPEESSYENADFQDELDAETLYNIIENQVIPTYFERDKNGIPLAWMQRVKYAISDILPHFTMKRMIDQYFEKFYLPLQARSKMFAANHFAAAKALSDWKARVYFNWDGIEVLSVDSFDTFNNALQLGDSFSAKIVLDLKQLHQDEVEVALIVAEKNDETAGHQVLLREAMRPTKTDGSRVLFECTIAMKNSGVFDYGFRISPKSQLLAYKHDLNLVRWI